MKQLMVSRDCGIHYGCEMQSESGLELLERTRREDMQWTRWYIEENGEMDLDHVCPIHANLLKSLLEAREQLIPLRSEEP
jgi:hypothetical protein